MAHVGIKTIGVCGVGRRGIVVHGTMHAGAGDMAGQTTRQDIGSTTAVVADIDFLATKAAGEQIRGSMETAPVREHS